MGQTNCAESSCRHGQCGLDPLVAMSSQTAEGNTQAAGRAQHSYPARDSKQQLPGLERVSPQMMFTISVAKRQRH